MGKSFNKFRASPDKNHKDVIRAFENNAGGLTNENEFGVRRCFVEGIPVELHDMHKVGGEIPDWMIIVDYLPVFIEMKPKRIVKDVSRQRLTDTEYYWGELSKGEKSFFENSNANVRICYNEETVWRFVKEIIDHVKVAPDER